ncbi:MAG: hypothetical protein HY717_14265 [Planctomycetes bacterium]|nr:hypothetical protein [Planctomycetota bacterium]
MNDGSEELLPAKYQLMEFLDVNFRSSDFRITKEELSAYFKSVPKIYSLDALIQFVKEVLLEKSGGLKSDGSGG